MYSSKAFPPFAHQARQTLWRRWTSTARFSVHGGRKSTKDGLVETVNRAVQRSQPDGVETKDALVVLASRKYAAWLQDEKFMSALLKPFAPNSSQGPGSGELNVLAAAVDGLHPLRAFGDAPQGFSFHHGSMEAILPNLWDENQLKPPRESKLQAAISFHFKSEKGQGDSSQTRCTLPLANTIFENGLQSTLQASRWRQPKPESSLELAHLTDRQVQDVNCSISSSSARFHIEAPLVPITAPRKILTGLGNIIRQIEADGKAAPASGELETAVQTLFDKRTKEGHEFPPGPVGVWAVVLPQGPMQAKHIERLQEWAKELDKKVTAEEEWVQALDSKAVVQSLLRHGARVYRILSGGGGWGKKQGLLSLDPETTYSPSSEEEDLDSFIRSFTSQHDGSAQEGVVAPGSYIQYFVTPAASARPALSAENVSTLSLAFGTSESALAEDSSLAEGPSGWELVPGHFGAVTSHGVFIASRAGDEPYSDESKLDTPGAWLGFEKESDM